MKLTAVLFLLLVAGFARAQTDNDSQQLLVTFDNEGARYQSSSFRPPYRSRKRYAVAPGVREAARAIAEEHALTEIEQWPLRSLSVYCIVFEVAAENAAAVLESLASDERIESVQPLNQFATLTTKSALYDDTYLSMQHSLDTIDLLNAHRVTQGKGVRIAVVDSDVDNSHEDLSRSIRRHDHLDHLSIERDQIHGTAVVSVIAATANNAVGIAGVAPEATLAVSEACWLDEETGGAVCDSFSIAKALDELHDNTPDVINLSLTGPEDPLLRRILLTLAKKGATIVAAAPNGISGDDTFPANIEEVIPVASVGSMAVDSSTTLSAPGEKILVAVPGDDYEFKSGSSLATAHVSGIVALLKTVVPQVESETVHRWLKASQAPAADGQLVVNACKALQMADAGISCGAN